MKIAQGTVLLLVHIANAFVLQHSTDEKPVPTLSKNNLGICWSDSKPLKTLVVCIPPSTQAVLPTPCYRHTLM